MSTTHKYKVWDLVIWVPFNKTHYNAVSNNNKKLLLHPKVLHQLDYFLHLRGPLEENSTPGVGRHPEVPEGGEKAGDKGEHERGAGVDAAHGVREGPL